MSLNIFVIIFSVDINGIRPESVDFP